MIFKRRIIVSLVLLLSGAVLSLKDDFKFDNDDLQVVFTDPVETITKSPSRFLYAKEISQCPATESKLMLTLLLKSRSWRDLSELKREKAIKKLSRFFAVPKEYLTVDDVSAPEIYEMIKHSINKSSNLLNTKQKIGRVEFSIGCGDKMFATGKIIAHRITEQMKSGVFDELTGIEFGYWNVWSKHVKSRVQRMKRASDGGSGDEDEEDYDDYDGENENEDGSDNEDTEDITEIPSHTHRHQHGSNTNKHKQVSVKQLPSVAMSQTQESPEIPQLSTKDLTMASETVLDVMDLPVTPPFVSVEIPVTPIDIDVAMRELESDVAKTIVDNINAAAAPEVVANTREVVDEIFEDLLSKFQQSTSFDALPTLPAIVEVTTMETLAPQTSKVTVNDVILTTIPSSTAEVVLITTTMTTTTQTETNLNVITNNNNSNNNNNNYNNNDNKNDDDDKLLITSTEKPSTTRSDDESGNDIESTLTQDTYQNTYTPTTSTPYVSTIVQSDELTTSEPSTATIASTTQLSLEETVALEKTKDFVTTTVKTVVVAPKKQSLEDNYDEEYDDDVDSDDKSEDNEVISPATVNRPKSSSVPPTTTEVLTTEATTIPPTTTTTTTRTTTVVPTTIEETTVTTQAPTTVVTTTESTTERTSIHFEDLDEDEDEEPMNTPPKITNRLQKVPVTAGKPFVVAISNDVFYDNEDGTNLKLELVDKNEQPLTDIRWIQFNAEKREIYGLPLEHDVSRWEFKLRATDSAGESVSENFDITVHQHKSYRSVNHNITLGVKLNKEFKSDVDWEVRLIRGIAEALDDSSMSSVYVREIIIKKDISIFTYTNETLPKDKCPEEQLRQLMARLSINSLNSALEREIIVKSLTSEMVGSCLPTVPKNKPLPSNTKNFAPLLKNQVDRVNASVGQLLVFKVPQDTFYDPEDMTDLKLTLINEDRTKLDPNHWLQFDSKNNEFYGVPGPNDVTDSRSYILIAEDKSGVTASDALIVVVTDRVYKREYNAAFDYQLEVGIEQFSNAAAKRKFIERVLQVFGDTDAKHLLISSVKKIQYAGRTSVILVNTTLPKNHRECPHSDIKALRNVLLLKDATVRDIVKETIGNEFNVMKINMIPSGKCAGGETYHHEEVTMKPEETEAPIITDDVLVTYVLPAAIILLMLLIALIIACILYKRRLTGKMELGDEEERKSFRSRGIPVIFQDELDEKPEIGNKSPIILKDEKPPLLPHYNGLNPDDHEDVDEYVPPQPLMMGSRESRGKSPVTPSYRKPPPYVSP